MILFFGEYGFFKNNLLKIQGNIGEREFITTDEKFINEGFKKCGNISYCFSIRENQGISAYYVETFCIYKGYKFQATDILSNGKFRIWHSIEAQNHFKDYARHGHDPHLEVEQTEIEEIWEERKPIEGFVFNVEPIFYLKK